jgi:hypothetical protein
LAVPAKATTARQVTNSRAVIRSGVFTDSAIRNPQISFVAAIICAAKAI